MRIAITHCPLWTNLTPNYSVALLGTCLTQNGHDVIYPEIEIEFYHHVSNEEKQLWQPLKGGFWGNASNVVSLCEKYKESFFVPLVNLLKSERIELLAFSVNNCALAMTSWLANLVRKELPNIRIIAGGPTSFSAPQLIWNISEIDAVCLGEGESALIKFIDSWVKNGWPKEFPGFAVRQHDGSINNSGFAEGVINLDLLPFPDYSRFNLYRYQSPNTLPTTISRGCIQRCAYCAESPHFGKFRYRRGIHLYDEIVHHLKSCGLSSLNLLLNDSLINGNIEALEEFADCLIEQPLPVTFGGMAVSRKEMTINLLNKLNQAGCRNLSFGVESGSQAVLKMMKKNLHTPESTITVLKDCKMANINTTVFIIVGFPGEDENLFYETIDFLRLAYPYIDTLMVNVMLILEGSNVACYPDRYGLDPNTATGGDFITLNNDNTYSIRRKRQELVYLLFQEKMFLLNEIGGTAFDPVKNLLQREAGLKQLINSLQPKLAELVARDKNSVDKASFIILYDNLMQNRWQFNDQLRTENGVIYSLGDDPFMVSIPLPFISPEYIKVSIWHDRIDQITAQLFWLDGDAKEFTEKASCQMVVPGSLASNCPHTIYFNIKELRCGNSTPIHRLRFDPISTPGEIIIYEICAF